MKSKWIIMAAVLLAGCRENLTKYYEDPQNQPLAIFSNKGNNILSCYLNGAPWRTINRLTGGFLSPSVTELVMYKQTDSSSQTSLVFRWNGFLVQQPLSMLPGTITLYLKVPQNFSKDDISSLQGQRILLDSSNYFVTQVNGYEGISQPGSGSVYFNKASYDSTAGGAYSGELSGLLEAAFPGFALTNGRFDHQLSSWQVGF